MPGEWIRPWEAQGEMTTGVDAEDGRRVAALAGGDAQHAATGTTGRTGRSYRSDRSEPGVLHFHLLVRSISYNCFHMLLSQRMAFLDL